MNYVIKMIPAICLVTVIVLLIVSLTSKTFPLPLFDKTKCLPCYYANHVINSCTVCGPPSVASVFVSVDTK